MAVFSWLTAPGGIYSEGVLTLDSCTVSGNRAQYGGGIYSTTGSLSKALTLQNTTVSGNRSYQFGGGLYSDDGKAVIESSTFTNNVALKADEQSPGYGNGICTGYSSAFNRVELHNSIVSGNPLWGLFDLAIATNPTSTVIYVSNGYNLVDVCGPGIGTTFTTAKHDSVNVSNPKLGPLQDNGGPTFTHLPQTDSPVLHQGDTDLTLDQRGVARPFGTADDIGAVEYTPTQPGPNFVVNDTGDGNDGACSLTDCSLREAINAANANPDTSNITFSPTVFSTRQTITVGSALSDIINNTNIIAPTAGVKISGNGILSPLRVTGGQVVFSALTIFNAGFGITNSGGAVRVQRCTFDHINNDAFTNESGSAVLENSTFVSNGVGVAGNGGTVSVQSCTLSANTYGIRTTSLASLRVDNSIAAGNNSGNSIPGTPTITNSIMTGTAAAAGLETSNGLPVLKENGGPTPTVNLLAGGAAVDTGSTSLTTDQRGVPRPQGSADDKGAVEFDAIQSGPYYVVNTTSDVYDANDGGCTVSHCTLRDAINAANADTTSIIRTITFSPTVFSTPQTIALSGTDVAAITRNTTITAPTVGVTIASGGLANGLQVTGGTVVFSGLTFSNFSGQGLNNSGGALTVQGCTFSGNGTGLRNDSGSLALQTSTFRNGSGGLNIIGGTALVQRCTFHNLSVYGIRNEVGGSTVQNSTVVKCDYGIYGSTGNINLYSCTVSGNNYGVNGFVNTVNLFNSIVAGNTTDIPQYIVNTNSNTLTGTLAQVGLQGSGTNPTLADNGGPTQTVAIVPGSPAIDAAGDTGLDSDQRGIGRPQAVADDIGAVEYREPEQNGPNFEVNKTTDTNDGNCGANDCTLREAINAANANTDTSIITFKSTVFTTSNYQIIYVNGTPLPAITTNMSIQGIEKAVGIAPRDIANPVGNGLMIDSGTANLTVGLSNLSLMAFTNKAIHNIGGNVTMVNMGVYLDHYSFVTSQVGVTNTGTLTARSCTLGRNGTAISNSGTLTLENSTVAFGSRGLFNNNGTATVKSATFADITGTAIDIGGGSVHLSNSIVAGNGTNINGTPATNTNNLVRSTLQEAGLETDPVEADLKNNGGPTPTIAILFTSPALNAAGDTGLDTDQRGIARPQAGADGIGAYEFNALTESLMVTTLADEDNGTSDVRFGTGTSLREAINYANSNADQSNITFASGLTGTLNLQSALPDLSSNLSITGPGATSLTIQRNVSSLFRIFRVTADKTVSIKNITIKNGNVTGNGNGTLSSGGAILNDGALTLTDCTLRDNIAEDGAAIYQNGGSLSLVNCTLSNNTANASGGGIFNGGATLTVTSSTLSGNKAQHGASIYQNGGSLSLVKSTLSGNEASSEGGSVYQNAGTLSAQNSTISGNKANDNGGALRLMAGTANLDSATVTLNRSDADNNGSGTGGGIFNSGATLTLQNTIVAGNFKGTGSVEDNLTGPAPSGSHNFVSGDPKLGPLANNGGPTQTHLPQSGSPALNAGNTNLGSDQIGTGRPQIGVDDIGAVEVIFSTVESLVVTTLVDEDNGTSDPAYGTGTSLREAMVYANNDNAASTITFAPALFANGATRIIQLTGSLPQITRNLTLRGPGAKVLTVRRNTGGNYRILDITFNLNPQVIINGLTIANGHSNSGGGFENRGTLTLMNCTLSGNTADQEGGSIFNFGNLEIFNCTFSGNSAQFGGAIYNYNEGNMTVHNSTFTGNSAYLYGGAIATAGNYSTIKNCTITGNTASPNNGGGIILAGETQLQMGNTILVGNTGADIFLVNGVANIQSLGYNLVGDGNVMSSFGAANHDQTGVATTSLKLDPAGLQDNGGQTPTIAILADSPARHGGHNNGIPADTADDDGDGNTTEPAPFDQRGTGYPRIQGSAVDIGAYEFQQLNTAPTATDPNTFTAISGVGKALTLMGTDAENDTLTYKITSLPTNGTLYDGPSINGPAITAVPYTLTDANHQVTYLASSTYSGSDTFGFKVNDNALDSDEKTVVGTVIPPVASAGAIVSEFRTRGPNGSRDEYVEIANTTGATLNLSGWSLLYPSGSRTATVTIPANTVLPKGGHLLFTGSAYSLGSYATGDVTLTADVPDDGGVVLRNAGSTAVDAVGFAGANAAYKLGNGISANITGTDQTCFMRKQNGTPFVNSGNNASDFDFVAITGGLVDGIAAKLGAPGPKSLNSPDLRNDTLSAVALPVFRDTTATGMNATYGTLALRYKVTNNGTQKLTRLRFRAVMIPAGAAISGGTWQTANGTADLRLLTSADTTATINGNPVPVKGSTLEEPPVQANGGGLNSSMSLDLSGLPGSGIAAGETVNVQFTLGVVVKGTYRVVLNMEGLN